MKNFLKSAFNVIHNENKLSYGRIFCVWILCQNGVTFLLSLELYLRHFWSSHIKTEMFPNSKIAGRVKICHWWASVKPWGPGAMGEILRHKFHQLNSFGLKWLCLKPSPLGAPATWLRPINGIFLLCPQLQN